MKNIYYLLRQEFYDQRKRAMVFGAVIFLINLVSRIIEEIAVKFGSMGNHNYQEGIGGYLFAAGFIFTSMCFATSDSSLISEISSNTLSLTRFAVFSIKFALFT
jgi:hypothetical protein